MNDRWERLGASTGIAFVVAVIAAFILQPPPPDVDASAREVSQFFVDHQGGVRVTVAVLSLALFFFLWFLGSLHGTFSAAEGGGGRLSAILLAGGIIVLVAILIAVTTAAVAAFRPQELSPDVIVALNDLGQLSVGVAAFAFVAFFASAALLTLRTGALPAWLGWLAAVTAVFNGLGIGNIFTASGAFAADGILGFLVPFILFLLWFLAASVVLVRGTGTRNRGGTTAT